MRRPIQDSDIPCRAIITNLRNCWAGNDHLLGQEVAVLKREAEVEYLKRSEPDFYPLYLIDEAIYGRDCLITADFEVEVPDEAECSKVEPASPALPGHAVSCERTVVPSTTFKSHFQARLQDELLLVGERHLRLRTGGEAFKDMVSELVMRAYNSAVKEVMK